MKVSDISKEELKRLYDEDFPQWAEINLQLLKEKAYELVDWDNLLEEIEDMSRSDLKACVSFMVVILEHLYKFDNFKDLAGGETAGKSWIRSIENSRDRLNLLFNRYPSLRIKTLTELSWAWEKARVNLRIWLRNNNYNPDNFNIPENCPYSFDDIINRKL
ncbi:MAG: DUF29 domain-containing protein [Hydrogenothermaceae bacterium]|nr:DUF29 domain-containing protein [Hydrogenothermaceae bacterium]